MKDFQRAGRLRSLPLESRLVYSGFVVFALLGFASSVLLYDDSLGRSLAATSQYYLGDGGDLAVPKSFRTLLETTHFHLFTISVVWLILVHLYLLTRDGRGAKRFWVAASFLAVLVHVAAPWLVRYAGAPFSALMAGSGAALAAAFLWLSLRPLWEMWAPASR